MKVFIVIGVVEYDGSEIVGVFSDEARAKEARNDFSTLDENKKFDGGFFIQEWEVS